MAAIISLACVLLVYMKDWHTVTIIKVHTLSTITTFFLIHLCTKIMSGKRGKKRNNAKPGLRAMHAVCPAMLGPLAFDLKKDVFVAINSRLYAAAHSHCC